MVGKIGLAWGAGRFNGASTERTTGANTSQIKGRNMAQRERISERMRTSEPNDEVNS